MGYEAKNNGQCTARDNVTKQLQTVDYEAKNRHNMTHEEVVDT